MIHLNNMINISVSHVCKFDSSKIHDAKKESEDKNIDHTILENEWVVAEFMKKSIISCYVGQ